MCCVGQGEITEICHSTDTRHVRSTTVDRSWHDECGRTASGSGSVLQGRRRGFVHPMLILFATIPLCTVHMKLTTRVTAIMEASLETIRTFLTEHFLLLGECACV